MKFNFCSDENASKHVIYLNSLSGGHIQALQTNTEKCKAFIENKTIPYGGGSPNNEYNLDLLPLSVANL